MWVCLQGGKKVFVTWPGTGTVDTATTECIIQLYCIPCSVWLHIPLAQRHDFRLIPWVDHSPTIHFWGNKHPSVDHTFKKKKIFRQNISWNCLWPLFNLRAQLAQRCPWRIDSSWSQRKSCRKGKANRMKRYIYIGLNLIYKSVTLCLCYVFHFAQSASHCALLQTPKLYKLDVFNHGHLLVDMRRRISWLPAIFSEITAFW